MIDIIGNYYYYYYSFRVVIESYENFWNAFTDVHFIIIKAEDFESIDNFIEVLLLFFMWTYFGNLNLIKLKQS